MGDLRDLFEEQYALLASKRDERYLHVERDLALLDQRLTRLTDVLIDGTIDKSTYDERKADLLSKGQALKEKLENDTEMTYWQDVAEKFELANTAYLSYLSANDEEKRNIVKLVSSDFSVEGKEPVLSMFFPFDEIRNWSISTYGAPYQGAVRTFTNFPSKKKSRKNPQVAKLLEYLVKKHRREVSAFKLIQSAAKYVPQVPGCGGQI
jgi:hypothetical protein